MTVSELREILEKYEGDLPVVGLLSVDDNIAMDVYIKDVGISNPYVHNRRYKQNGYDIPAHGGEPAVLISTNPDFRA